MNNQSITIGPVRIGYAHVFKPRFNDLAKKEEYSLVALIPKDAVEQNGNPSADIAALQAAIKEAAEGMKPGWKSPLLDGDKELNGNGNPKHPGYWFIKAKSGVDFPPLVVDERRVPIGSGFTSGDWAKVRLRLKAYEVPTSRGVSAYLQAVQWLIKDTPFGSDPMEGFEEVQRDEDFDPFA